MAREMVINVVKMLQRLNFFMTKTEKWTKQWLHYNAFKLNKICEN